GSSAVAYVLTTCAKLRSFVGKGHMIDASQAVQGPAWVCRDIERLHIEVYGIPRVGGQGPGTSEDKVTISSAAQGLSIGVFKRLALLTKLQELDLRGYTFLPDRLEYTAAGSFRSRGMTPEVSESAHPLLRNSLELSLASGLHHLTGLKNLRRIGVLEVDLCIGHDELDWMKEHWRLEAWMGLRPFVDRNLENLRLLRMIKETWPSISTS
ncbi:hypothetical protein BGZ82_005885, partial [Podila clonocystis]